MLFLRLFEMIMWFLTFLLLMWCKTLIDLRILNHPCEPGLNPTWSWYTIFLIFCWIQLAKILLRIFVSIVIKDIGLQFSFLVVSLSGFGIRVMVVLHILFLMFFFVFGLAHDIWKSLGQGSNPCHSSDASHCHDSVDSLPCYTTRELLFLMLYLQ